MYEKIGEIQNETTRYKSDILMNEAIYFDQHEKSSSFGKISFYSDKNNFLSKNCGEIIIRYFDQHINPINTIQVDQNSNRFISASQDYMIMIWNLETRECLEVLKEHQESVKSILIIPNN